MNDKDILSVRDLNVRITTERGEKIQLLRGVSFDVKPAEIVGIAGESGSGKTVTTLAILGLLPGNVEVSGSARLNGQELIGLPQRALREIRGKQVGMIFQDPLASLHPMLRIDRQLTDHMRRHLGLSKKQAYQRAVELIADVQLPDPEGAMRRYPHEFSGGMRQRLCIASALACGPALLVGDEPTTALDVTVQAGFLALLQRMRDEHGTSILLITHDLGVLGSVADRVNVFYSGRVVETGTRAEVLGRTRHPYTRALLGALPAQSVNESLALVPIRGMAPAPSARPTGCAFHPRCDFAVSQCASTDPADREIGGSHHIACDLDPLDEPSEVTA